MGWNEFDEMRSALNQLRANMDRVFEDVWASRSSDGAALPVRAGMWPRANLIDSGTELVLVAEVPGLSERDIKLTLSQEVLTIAGERMNAPPDGYSTHRQERPAVTFSRSFALPCRVNPERTNASVKNGILTVTLEKMSDAIARQIAIKAGR
jgi:HSP20 family protein